MAEQGTCLNCRRTSSQVPLIRVQYADQEHWICPQCLPILIHKPERLPAVAGPWTSGGGAPPDHD